MLKNQALSQSTSGIIVNQELKRVRIGLLLTLMSGSNPQKEYPLSQIQLKGRSSFNP